jgi:hypothetical protein
MSIRNVSATVLANTAPRRYSDLLNKLNTLVEAELYRHMQRFPSAHPESTVRKRLVKYVRGVRKKFGPIPRWA